MTVHILLFFALTLWMSYVTNTFLLVRSSVRSKQLLRFVHGQGQKSENNQSPLLTMPGSVLTSREQCFEPYVEASQLRHTGDLYKTDATLPTENTRSC